MGFYVTTEQTLGAQQDFPMIQKLLITCGPITFIPRSATEEIPKSSKYYTHTIHKVSNQQKLSQSHNTQNFDDWHTYTELHVSLFIRHVNTKNMPHPPQEGSNRSLAYCTLLSVSW